MSDEEYSTRHPNRRMTSRRERSRSRTPTRNRYEKHPSSRHHPESYASKSDVAATHLREDRRARDYSPPRHSGRRQSSPESRRYPPERHRRSITPSVSRSRSRSRSPKRSKHPSKHSKKRRGHSPSESGSDNEKKSKSEQKDKRKREHKHKHKHRDRSRSQSPRRHKKHKKEKQEKTIALTSQWGKYGVISESDMYNKEEEFKTWLVEECKTNPETLNKDQTKKYFARYMEDYNTATLPHEKFYNMKHYESRMNLLRNGELLPQGDEDTYDFDADYRAHTSALKHSTSSQAESYITKEKLQELRQVERERVELIKRKQLGMEVRESLGVRMDGHLLDE